MNTTLQISVTIGITIFFGIILQMLRKKKLNLSYTLVWLLTGIILVFAALFPDLVKVLSRWIGVEVTSNFVFMLVGLFTLLIILSLTVIVSKQHTQIFRLSQSISLLEKRIRELEKGA